MVIVWSAYTNAFSIYRENRPYPHMSNQPNEGDESESWLCIGRDRILTTQVRFGLFSMYNRDHWRRQKLCSSSRFRRPFKKVWNWGYMQLCKNCYDSQLSKIFIGVFIYWPFSNETNRLNLCLGHIRRRSQCQIYPGG